MGQSANNFRFDITAWDGHYNPRRDLFEECFNLAFANNRKADAYKIAARTNSMGMDALRCRDGEILQRPVPVLIFYWHNSGDGSMPFLVPMDAQNAAAQARAWLASLDYGPEPDHDGSNSKGWRIYNEAWGHVANDSYAFCAVEPAWLMHGK